MGILSEIQEQRLWPKERMLSLSTCAVEFPLDLNWNSSMGGCLRCLQSRVTAWDGMMYCSVFVFGTWQWIVYTLKFDSTTYQWLLCQNVCFYQQFSRLLSHYWIAVVQLWMCILILWQNKLAHAPLHSTSWYVFFLDKSNWCIFTIQHNLPIFLLNCGYTTVYNWLFLNQFGCYFVWSAYSVFITWLQSSEVLFHSLHIIKIIKTKLSENCEIKKKIND